MSDRKEKEFANSFEMETVILVRQGANSVTIFLPHVDMASIVEEKLHVDFPMYQEPTKIATKVKKEEAVNGDKIAEKDSVNLVMNI